MPPRVPPARRYARRVIEDEESDELPEDEQYDEDDEEQMDDMDDEDEELDELEEDEDDYVYEAPKKTGLKIKLNVGAPKGKSGGTAVSTPGETPPYAMPRKRGRKSRVIAASDDEAEEQEEEDDLEGEFPGSAAAAAQPARMTARQAAIAGGSGPVEHVSLEEPANPRKRKWTEEEIAIRREEAARKRKLKGAQRQEDEKQMIINRLINKGSGGKRGRWANKQAAKEKEKEKEPTPDADEAGEEDGEPTGAAGEGTEAGEGNETTSGADEEEENGVATATAVAGAPPRPATRGRGGWRGRGRRGRGARLPPPPIKMHIPYMRWVSGVRDIVVEDDSIKVETTATDSSKPTEAVDKPKPAEEKQAQREKEPYISLSIPIELLAATTINEPEAPLSRAASTCAVRGCTQTRKYKLVGSPDPEVGACGIAHLTTLQNSISVS